MNKVIHIAASTGDIEAVRRCIKKRHDIDTKDVADESPLHKAAEGGHLDVANTLMQAGADLHAKNRDQDSPLHIAAEKGHHEVVKALIQAGADANAKNKYYYTPLHKASKGGHAEVINVLLMAEADVKYERKYHKTPLHYAVKGEHNTIVESLIRAGAEINVEDENHDSPLHYAATAGHKDLVDILVRAGADASSKNIIQHSPLHNAATAGHKDVVDILVRAGADTSTKNIKGKTPLLLATENGDVDIVKILITAGADVDIRDRAQQSPVYLAAKYGHKAVFQLLIDAGADVKVTDEILSMTLIGLMRIKAFRRTFCQCFHLPREPVNVFGMKDRFSYAATFGAITFLCFEIAVKQRYIIDIGDGGASKRVVAIVVSILVYSLDYFPLLAALAEKTIVGDIVGTAYILCLTSLYLTQKIGCYGIHGRRLKHFLQNLPIFMCLIFLTVSFPGRLIVSARRQFKDSLVSTTEMSEAEYDSIRKSPTGRHCTDLLKRTEIKPNETKKDGDGTQRLLEEIKQLPAKASQKLVYRSMPYFRYSVRMVSVVIVALILIYMISTELLVLVIPILRDIKFKVNKKLKIVEALANVTEPVPFIDLSFTHRVLIIAQEVAIAVEACVLVSLCVAGILGLANIIHTLTSYRKYLRDINRGKCNHISHRTKSQNTDLLVGGMRYAGYQIGFTIFTYAIHALVLFGVTLSISLLIFVVKYGKKTVFLRVVGAVWPTILFSIMIDTIQRLAAKFLFLQQKGNILAIKYRRAYLIFLYFTYIFNIVIGLMRCQYRILKTMLVGILTLSRLDHSALSRRFELYDTGFKSYVGFLHLENANSHPVLVTFIRLLRANPSCFKDHMTSFGNGDGTLKNQHMVELGSAFWRDDRSLRRTRARTKWFLIYTLVRNPQLQFTRRRNPEWLED